MANEESGKIAVAYCVTYVGGIAAGAWSWLLTESSRDVKNGCSYVCSPAIWLQVVQLTNLSSAILTSRRDVDNSLRWQFQNTVGSLDTQTSRRCPSDSITTDLHAVCRTAVHNMTIWCLTLTRYRLKLTWIRGIQYLPRSEHSPSRL